MIKTFLNRFGWMIIGGTIVVSGTVFAIQITVPSAPGSGFLLQSNSSGNYQTVSLTAGTNVTIATTSSNITISASGSGGSSFAFPFTVQTGYNSTSTVIGFNGLFSTASSTFSGNLFLTSGFANGLLYTGTNGLVQTTATTSVICTGTVTCTAFTGLGLTPITINGTGGGSGTSAFEIATTSTLALSQVAYIAQVSGRTTITGVGTSSIASGVGITVTNGATAYVLGAQPSIACNTANTTTFGCLTAGDWSRFNSATTTFSTGLTYTLATNAVTVNTSQNIATLSNLSNNGFVITSGSNGTLGIQQFPATIAQGGTNSSSFARNSIIVSDANGTALIATGTQLTVGNLIATTSATSYFLGKVGIGTTSPTSPLEVANTNSGIATLNLNAPNVANAPWLQLTTVGLNVAQVQNSGGFKFVSLLGGNNNQFVTNAGNFVVSNNSTELARITSAGNLGLGTTTPYNLLTLYKAGSTAATSPQLVFSASSTVSGLGNFLNNWAVGTDLADGGKFKISSSSVVGTNDRFVIDGNGNVGIGTASPTQALEVNGSIKATSLKTDTWNFVTSSDWGIHFNAAGTGLPGTRQFVFDTGSGTTNYVFGASGAYLNAGPVAIGTTTAIYSLTIASSTAPQLSLSAGAGISQFTFRNAGGNLYIATTTTDATATTTTSALSIMSNGMLGIGTTTPTGNNVNGSGIDIYGTLPIITLTDSANKCLMEMLSTANIGIVGTGSNCPIAFVAGGNVLAGMDVFGNLYALGQGFFATSTGASSLVSYSATKPQLELSAGAGQVLWTARNAGGNLYLATTTVQGNATSTQFAMRIDTNGNAYFPAGSASASSQTGYWCYDANGQLIRDTTTCLVSALKFKTDIHPLTLGLDTVLAMKSVTYKYKDQSFGKGEQIGFIADWAEKVVPQLVTHDSTGAVHGFNYEQYTSILNLAIQQLSAKVDNVKGVARKAEENWQDILIGLLILGFIYQQYQIRKLKK